MDSLKTNEKASAYLWLALAAFLVLMAELPIMLVGSLFHGTIFFFDIGRVGPILIHWGFTCAVWGLGAWLLCRAAKKRGFDIFESRTNPPLINWSIVLVIMAALIAMSYISWEGFKPVMGFAAMERRFGGYALIAFIAQHIYYFFEVAIFLPIIAFGQKYGEMTFKKNSIPWGGILCGLTWGLVHILTQQSLFVGIVAAVWGLAYGITYLLLKKNIRYTYPIILLMFVL